MRKLLLRLSVSDRPAYLPVISLLYLMRIFFKGTFLLGFD